MSIVLTLGRAHSSLSLLCSEADDGQSVSSLSEAEAPRDPNFSLSRLTLEPWGVGSLPLLFAFYCEPSQKATQTFMDCTPVWGLRAVSHMAVASGSVSCFKAQGPLQMSGLHLLLQRRRKTLQVDLSPWTAPWAPPCPAASARRRSPSGGWASPRKCWPPTPRRRSRASC